MDRKEFDELLPEFIEGAKCALEFTLEEEHDSNYDDASDLLFENGCRLFLNKTYYLFQMENQRRAELGIEDKEFDDYARDFFFTAFGHGVGFWEVSHEDWLFANDTLTIQANKIFHTGISAYVEDGKIFIG